MDLGADKNNGKDVVLDEDAGREHTDTNRCHRAWITGIAMDFTMRTKVKMKYWL
jgi:hypothetical protein